TVPTAGAPLPAPGSSDIATGTPLTVSFSEAMDAASLAAGFQLRDDDGDPVAATVSYDAETSTATLTPTAPLASWRVFYATTKGGTGGITDLAGNPIANDYTWTFSTRTPFLVEPGPAVQDGTSTPIAQVGPDGLSLDFGLVPEAREFLGVLRVTNVSEAEQDARFMLQGLDQVNWAHFDSSSGSGVTLAPGESTLLNVETSSLVAGYGAGSLRLELQAGSGLHEDYATTIAQAPEAPGTLTGVARAGGVIGLTWAASGTTTNVFGYDVYRATGGGAFTKLNIVPITGTAYDDTTTVDGTSYRYVVRTLSTGAPPLASVDSPVEAVAADASLSTIQSVIPAAGATGVAQNTTVRATFGEPMNAATINSSTFQLRNPSGALVGATVTYNATTRVATLTPTANLAVAATYQATVKGGPSGVADVAGNRNASDYTWSFTTRFPYSIAQGTAVQPGTTTRIATGDANTLQLDFGLVPSARTITSVFTVTNTSGASLSISIAPIALGQIASTRFASSGSSSATLANGASTSVTVVTSSTVAGYGSGSIRLTTTGTNAMTKSYPAQIREAPQAPTGVTAAARAAGAIAVSWTATTSTTNLAGYDVYRSSGGGAYTKRNAATVTGTSYTDTGTNGTAYTYRLRALSTGSPALQSLDSTTATATADSAAPATPSSVTLANGGGSGNAYINLANRASISVGVGVPSSALASDTLTVTLTSGSQSVSKTSPSRTGSGTVTVTGINATSLPDGTVTISVTARDVAGNVSPARTRTNTKDTVAPGIPTASYVDRTSPTTDQITGTAAASSTVRATRTAPSTLGPYTATANSSGAYTVTVAAARNVTVTYTINATDAAGNTGANRTLTFTARN
ncbi:MAG TPA: Ig-like domain-containing protein, partial [Desertimonas sp.]|nr:Ig-like domain-containing protein [Desertimonas sp.]